MHDWLTEVSVDTDNEGLHMYPGNCTVCPGIIADMSHKAYKHRGLHHFMTL
jgi:hypothetical protein